MSHVLILADQVDTLQTNIFLRRWTIVSLGWIPGLFGAQQMVNICVIAA
jgi:hypothetical protein